MSVNLSQIQWQIATEHRDLLFDQGGLRLEQWLREGHAQVVKQGPHRTVYHVTLPELDFYLKHNRVQSKQSRLKTWLRPSKARLEHQRAVEVASRNVPTITPLAYGETTEGESYLLTHALPETQALSHFLEIILPTLPDQRQTRLRQRIAHVLGTFLAKMHNRGILHRDLHPANVLLRLDDHDQPTLFLIDLDMVHVRGSLSWRARRDNLVILNRWFALRCSRSDRLRFWQSYASEMNRDLTRRRSREIENHTAQSNHEFWRGLDPRCTKTNRRFRKVRSQDVTGHVVTDFDDALLAELMRNPDAPFERADAQWLKRGRSSSVIELSIPLAGQTQRVIYKRFNVTKAHDPIVNLLRDDPAIRSWINGHGLRQRWLPTPRPLAVFHRRRNGMSTEGYLITAKIEPTQELHEFIVSLDSLTPPRRRDVIQRTIETVAKLVREMHERQISHRDLKACNVLVVPDLLINDQQPHKEAHVSDAPSPIDHWPLRSSAAWLIDLVGVQRCRRLRDSRKIQNLARLCISFLQSKSVTRTDRLRFLRCYQQWGLRGKESWKEWWHEIGQAIESKIKHNKRTGRPLTI